MHKIYRTDQAKRDYKTIFKESAKRFGVKVANETIAQIEKAERKISENPQCGRLDPTFHSRKYRYIQTKNRQKIFYVEFPDALIIVTAGYDGRNWLSLLEENEEFISQQIEKALDKLG